MPRRNVLAIEKAKKMKNENNNDSGKNSLILKFMRIIEKNILNIMPLITTHVSPEEGWWLGEFKIGILSVFHGYF